MGRGPAACPPRSGAVTFACVRLRLRRAAQPHAHPRPHPPYAWPTHRSRPQAQPPGSWGLGHSTLRSGGTSNLGIAFKSSLGLKREIKEKKLVFRHLEKPIYQRLVLIENSGREHPIAARILAESLRKRIEEVSNDI